MYASQQPGAVSKPIQVAARRSMFIIGPLALFTLSELIFALLGETVKTHLFWYIRYTDLMDLVITAPLYIISFVWLEEQFVAARAPNWLRRSFLILALLFLYGHSMHVTGNAVNTFSTEIHDYLSQIPADTYALLYFFDETLSHYIIYFTRFGIFACYLLFDALSGNVKGPATASTWAFGLGCLYGVWAAIAFTEGQKPFLLPILVIALGIIWLVLWRRQGGKAMEFLRSGPMKAFIAGLVPFAFIGLLLYFLIIGGFTEPSKIGL